MTTNIPIYQSKKKFQKWINLIFGIAISLIVYDKLVSEEPITLRTIVFLIIAMFAIIYGQVQLSKAFFSYDKDKLRFRMIKSRSLVEIKLKNIKEILLEKTHTDLLLKDGTSHRINFDAQLSMEEKILLIDYFEQIRERLGARIEEA